MSKIKVSNGVVKSLITCLDEMTKRNTKLPVKVWYGLSFNRGQLLSADKHTESARIKLVEKFGEKNEQEDVTKVPQEKMAEFQKEYIELLEMEVEIDVRKIKMSTLENGLDKMDGVQGIFNFFEYLVEDDTENESL